MHSSVTIERMEWKPRNGKSEKVSFQMVKERETMLFDDLPSPGNEFQRVETSTEQARVPAYVLTQGTDNNRKPDEQSFPGFGSR